MSHHYDIHCDKCNRYILTIYPKDKEVPGKYVCNTCRSKLHVKK